MGAVFADAVGVVVVGVEFAAVVGRAAEEAADGGAADEGAAPEGVAAEDAVAAADEWRAPAAPLLAPMATPAFACLAPDPLSAKKSRQMGSTLAGSARNCWYFSSTNQSLGPNSGTAADDTVVVRLFSNVKGGQSRLNLVWRSRTAGRRGVTHYPSVDTQYTTAHTVRVGTKSSATSTATEPPGTSTSGSSITVASAGMTAASA